MKNIEDLFLLHHCDIHAAIEKLDNNAAHIVLVINDKRQLVGTVTDGDVRRGILRGISLGDSIKKIMNPQPIVAKWGDERGFIYNLMRSKQIRQIPVLDEQGQVHKIEILDDFSDFSKKPNAVVLMAGGLSTRLRPLTNDCPKPMLKVGGKPILETILLRLIEYGFQTFYISINYLADQIQSYFKDGSQWGITIHYLQEDEKMGTAGSLSLLPLHLMEAPIVVMNSDLLTTIDFNKLLTFHEEQGQKATLCVREFDYTVPYGVCRLEENHIVEIQEKPTYKFFINAGVYVIEPNLLNVIPAKNYLDMPTFFTMLLNAKEPIAAFPVREYWLDIGQMSDFEKAHQEYNYNFVAHEG